jgi:hypothetical protein
LRQISRSLRSRSVLLHSLDTTFRLLQLAYDKRKVSRKSEFQRVVKRQVGDELGRVRIDW